MLMKFLLLIFFSVIAFSSSAQIKKYSVLAEGGGAVSLFRFSKDSLVPPKRQGKTGVSSDGYAGVYFLFSLHNPAFKYKVGIGYTERGFTLNKYSFGDFFTSLFLFDSYGNSDSFHLQSVHIRNQYVNIPVGFSYRLSKNKRRICEVYTGIQLNSNILVTSNAAANFDSIYIIPTTSQKNAVEKRYAQTSGRFLVSLMPRMDLRFTVYRELGIDMTLFPFIFDINSSNKELISGAFGFVGLLGVHYDF